MAYTEQERPFRLIIPKKGRLRDDFEMLMARAGLAYESAGDRLDYGTLYDREGEIEPIETLMQRPSDALETLAAGVADLAIVGLDTLAEFNLRAYGQGLPPLRQALSLEDISKCSLQIAAAASMDIKVPADLSGLRIATSYPRLLENWLGYGEADIVVREGGVEDTVRLGLADAIFDIVQTGESLKANGLVPKLAVMECNAVLVAGTTPLENSQQRLSKSLTMRLSGMIPALV